MSSNDDNKVENGVPKKIEKSAEEENAYDKLWDRLPHISLYQVRLNLMVGYIGIIGGIAAIYPVFAQYKPPVKCQTVLDSEEFSFLTFDQKVKISTDTPECKDYNQDDSNECYHCNFPDLSSCDKVSTYDEIYECTSQPEFQQQYTWTECEDHTFDRSIRDIDNLRGEPWQTAATSYKLYCGREYINAAITSMAMVGLFFGAFVAGMYSDKFGRKNAIVVFTFVEIVCMLAHVFMPNVAGFTVFRVLTEAAHHVTWIGYIAYAVEILGPSRRAIGGILPHVFYSTGYILSSLLGYLLPDWQGFTMALAVISAGSVLTFPFFPESFPYYFNSGKIEQGLGVLKQFQKRTNTELSQEFLDEFVAKVSAPKTEKKATTTYSILDLFRNGRGLLLISLNLSLCFFVNVLVYYGLSYNAAQLPGSLYVNNAINGLVELIANFICLYLLDKLGRKLLLCGCMIMGGTACLLAMILLEVSETDTDATAIASTWCSFIGKFAISGSFCTIYTFAAELYPTDMRAIGVGFCSMVSRIGGILAPFIILAPPIVANLIFGVSAIVSGACALFLPETAGRPTLVTLEEALLFYKGETAPNASQVGDENANADQISVQSASL